MGNTEFFRQSSDLQRDFKWKDIFSDVFRPHTPQEKEKILVSGCQTYMPGPDTMLKEWTKPWMFARFLLVSVVFCVLLSILPNMAAAPAKIALQIVFPAFIMPVTILLFFWEMNIPRNISILDLMKYMLFSGAISCCLTFLIRALLLMDDSGAAWIIAPIPEEIAKFIMVYLIIKKKDSKYILNGLLIGCAVGAGFAAIESAGYALYSEAGGVPTGLLNTYVMTGDIAVAIGQMNGTNLLRAVTAVGGHSVWAALYGAALAGAKKDQPLVPGHIGDRLVLITFISAVLLHTVWNFDLTGFLMTRFPDVAVSASIIIFWDGYYGRFIVLSAIAWAIVFWLMRMGLVQVIDVGRKSAVHKAQSSRNVQSPSQTPSNVHAGTVSVSAASGAMAGRSFSVGGGGSLLFGREQGASVAFSNMAKGISGRHCEIKQKEGVWVLIDRGSTYGTYFADGSRLEPNKPYRISNGMRFYLASKENEFTIHM